MSPDLLSLLVYTVGVKYRGINKKEVYRSEEMFSLSENMANKMLKVGMIDLIKHTRDHLVRIYPKGTRVRSTNYQPHRYWSAGAQLVAINWQTVGKLPGAAFFFRRNLSTFRPRLHDQSRYVPKEWRLRLLAQTFTFAYAPQGITIETDSALP